ncbi:MAG: transposase [Candidatus Staskawiczbacteria bacterium]|nr:transposase [Candidatus Staskawiczbacteria bacterium]
MLRKDPFITGEYYHIYNRGIDKRIIFKSKKDYERFIMLLYVSNSNEQFFRLDNLINQQHKTFNQILILEKGEPLISIGAWCLMPNHFHLLIKQEIDGGITRFMRKVGVGYSMFFNIKYQRSGSLFGGLFKSKLIRDDDNYMRQLFGYIHINSLDIEFPGWKDEIKKAPNDMKKFLAVYPYSSYLDYIRRDRIEKNIISQENFPDYFRDNQSFKDFVDDYFIRDDVQP